MRSKERSAIYLLANDGITSYYAGVGTYVKSYLDTFLENIYLKDSYDLYLITTYRHPKFFGYSSEITKNSEFLVKQYHGAVISVDDGLKGLEGYGGVKNWDLASLNAAKEINTLAKQYKRNFVIAIDTSFMGIVEHLNLEDITKLCVSPQSLESIHKSKIPKRFEWELKQLNNLKKHKDSFVSYSSEYLKKELMKVYSIPEEMFLNSLSGINFKGDRYKKIKTSTIIKRLKGYKIPLDRDIVFTLGRLEKYKGFKETIKFYNILRKNGENPFLIILGLSYTKNDPLVKEISDLYKKHQIDGFFYTKQDMELPLLLWQWKKCKYSLHLSKFEPFGMAPVEARYLAGDADGPIVITSKEGGLKEQCENKINGISVNYGDLTDYHDTIQYLNKVDRAKLRKRSREHVMKKYNAQQNILLFLNLLGIK